MCSSYWNLRAQWKCPACGHVNRGRLQTHYMGEVDSCQNEYKLRQPVLELADTTVTFEGGKPDSFIDSCYDCGAFIEFGAEIRKGRVMRVWPDASVMEVAGPAAV